ncbi:hypothetical protein Tco_0732971 [Tanacetum coccineum]
MFMRLFRSDDKFSQMLNQFESQPEYGGGSGSGGCGDDEPGDDEDGGEDEDDMNIDLYLADNGSLVTSPAMSPGNVAREGISFELFRSTYPGRHVARDSPDLSLRNMANVVV